MLAGYADPLAKGVLSRHRVGTRTYALSGGTNIGAHVGHRVEITGRTSGNAQKPCRPTRREARIDSTSDPR